MTQQNEPIPTTQSPTLVQHEGQWWYEYVIPDMVNYSGPFLGGMVSGSLTVYGCKLHIPAGVYAIATERGEDDRGD